MSFVPDRASYPFGSQFLAVDGGRMHYVDEGEGAALVMVHGTPTWSYLYRHLIAELSRTHRVVAPDLLGFGLSEKPENADYRPETQARRLQALLDRLGLRNVVLIVHDFGGPIGLSHAIEHPENVRALVLFNTWMWSLAGTPAERVGRLLGSRFGRFLYRRLNVSPRILLPAAFGDRRRLTREIHRHYVDALPTPGERQAPWVYARELIGSSEWFESLWERRERIARKPALLLWGKKDPAFTAEALARWVGALADARTVEFPGAGHFVQEEAPAEALREIRGFLSALDRSLPTG
jgi:pimeloyl-ACP methyl ester carboxylesterase